MPFVLSPLDTYQIRVSGVFLAVIDVGAKRFKRHFGKQNSCRIFYSDLVELHGIVLDGERKLTSYTRVLTNYHDSKFSTRHLRTNQ